MIDKPPVARIPSPVCSEDHQEPPPIMSKAEQKRSRSRPSRPPSSPPRMTRPEPGSLYDILHEHSGVALHVSPLCWTDQHTEVLGVEFEHAGAIVKPYPNLNGGVVHREPTKHARNLCGELDKAFRKYSGPMMAKTKSAKEVFRMLFKESKAKSKSNADLNLIFGKKFWSKAVRVPLVWYSKCEFGQQILDPDVNRILSDRLAKGGSPDYDVTNVPILAYLPKSYMKAIRETLYRVARGPNGQRNRAVENLQRLRSKALVPKDDDHDAYVFAVLLAMAQAHCYKQPSHKAVDRANGARKAPVCIPPPDLHSVKVQLLTHDDTEDNEDIIVYTAIVSETFLNRFQNPHKVPPTTEECQGGMKITITRIKIYPLLGLKERLAKVISEEFTRERKQPNPDVIAHEEELVLTEKFRPSQVWESPLMNSKPWAHAHHSFTSQNSVSSSDDDTDLVALIPAIKRKREEDADEVASNASSRAKIDDQGTCATSDGLLSPRAKRRRVTQAIASLEVC